MHKYVSGINGQRTVIAGQKKKVHNTSYLLRTWPGSKTMNDLS